MHHICFNNLKNQWLDQSKWDPFLGYEKVASGRTPLQLKSEAGIISSNSLKWVPFSKERHSNRRLLGLQKDSQKSLIKRNPYSIRNSIFKMSLAQGAAVQHNWKHGAFLLEALLSRTIEFAHCFWFFLHVKLNTQLSWFSTFKMPYCFITSLKLGNWLLY